MKTLLPIVKPQFALLSHSQTENRKFSGPVSANYDTFSAKEIPCFSHTIGVIHDLGHLAQITITESVLVP